MIIFRCNASATVGVGHLMRCRTLAAELKRQGVASVMVGPGEEWRTQQDAALFSDWVPMVWKDAISDAQALVSLARAYDRAVLVLDDYRVDEIYQRVLVDADLGWMQQFNSAAPPPFWGRWVVNGGPGEHAERYRPQMRNPQTRFLLGPDYAVLRPAFCTPREKQAQTMDKVLVALGGGDDRGVTRKLLGGLLDKGPRHLRYRIMSGRSNPSNSLLSEWVAGEASGRVELSIDPEDVYAEYAWADMAIIAGGTSTFEAAALGLPMLIIAMADNQLNQARGWVERGAAFFMGHYGDLHVETVVSALSSLGHKDKFMDMSLAARRAVDGRGCERLARVLVEAYG